MSNAKLVSTPMHSTDKFLVHSNTSLSRPDVTFAVNKLSQFMHRPSFVHWVAVKCVLHYLKVTMNYGLFLHSNPSFTLHVFVDADNAHNRDKYSSTSTNAYFLGPNLISWSSKKQATITRSTTEVEYHVIASTTIKVNWLTHMLRELDITLPSAPTIYCDNVGATYVCVNPVFHSRMKHITVDFHFVCDHLAKQQLRVSHVHSSDQLADCLTKPLARTQFHSHCSKLDILPNSLHLRGHDRTRL